MDASPSPLTVNCAWCGVHLKGPQTPAPGTPISHGICPACEQKLYQDWFTERDAAMPRTFQL